MPVDWVVLYTYVSPVHITVRTADELPIYRQIMRQVMEGIAGAILKPGDKLPSHRELSEQLVIAPLTVKKAYDELEAQGYLETRRGLGTFVAERPPRPRAAAQREQLLEAATSLLTRAYLAGHTLEEVIEVLVDADRHLLRDTRTTHSAKKRMT